MLEKLELIHLELIKEEGVNLSELPLEIQKKIKGFNLLYSKLKANPDNIKMFNTVQRYSVEIGDMIQNWIETDYEDSNEDENDDSKKDDKPVQKPVQKPTETVKPNQNQTQTFGNPAMEHQILSLLQSGNGRITTSDLSKVIGKSPDNPVQKVNNITLRKVFLSSAYRLV